MENRYQERFQDYFNQLDDFETVKKMIDAYNESRCYTPYIAVNPDGIEILVSCHPMRGDERHHYGNWVVSGPDDIWAMPQGSIRRLIGRDMTNRDEPVYVTTKR